MSSDALKRFIGERLRRSLYPDRSQSTPLNAREEQLWSAGVRALRPPVAPSSVLQDRVLQLAQTAEMRMGRRRQVHRIALALSFVGTGAFAIAAGPSIASRVQVASLGSALHRQAVYARVYEVVPRQDDVLREQVWSEGERTVRIVGDELTGRDKGQLWRADKTDSPQWIGDSSNTDLTSIGLNHSLRLPYLDAITASMFSPQHSVHVSANAGKQPEQSKAFTIDGRAERLQLVASEAANHLPLRVNVEQLGPSGWHTVRYVTYEAETFPNDWQLWNWRERYQPGAFRPLDQRREFYVAEVGTRFLFSRQQLTLWRVIVRADGSLLVFFNDGTSAAAPKSWRLDVPEYETERMDDVSKLFAAYHFPTSWEFREGGPLQCLHLRPRNFLQSQVKSTAPRFRNVRMFVEDLSDPYSMPQRVAVGMTLKRGSWINALGPDSPPPKIASTYRYAAPSKRSTGQKNVQSGR